MLILSALTAVFRVEVKILYFHSYIMDEELAFTGAIRTRSSDSNSPYFPFYQTSSPVFFNCVVFGVAFLAPKFETWILKRINSYLRKQVPYCQIILDTFACCIYFFEI